MALELIVQIKFGSHLYGTNTPTSDEDYKSVYVPNAREIILQRVTGSLQIGAKTKREGEKNLPGDVDNECYSLQRYLGLISEGQTVAVDMLFAPEPMLISDIWKYVQSSKERLLTKKSAAFVGYCRTQANKYGIKGSRVASAKNALERFEKLLTEYGTTAKVGEFFPEDDEVIDDHTRTLRKDNRGRAERYFECCNRMVGFTNTVKEAVGIFRRIHENYGDRARQAEKNEGGIIYFTQGSVVDSDQCEDSASSEHKSDDEPPSRIGGRMAKCASRRYAERLEEHYENFFVAGAEIRPLGSVHTIRWGFSVCGSVGMERHHSYSSYRSARIRGGRHDR